MFRRFLSNTKKWIKDNPLEFWTLLAILTAAAICRLYNIDQYMTFLGDEGRDVIVVRRFLTELHPPLIGPGTSVGNMYLGPLYYYMMAPALLIANFSPVGPAVQIAILGVITVWFIWFIAREWFGNIAGLVAAGLYALSPTAIEFARSSWNPNIMPFFALLSVYSIWKVWQEHKFNWLVVLGVAYAFVLQSHYLGLLLAPTLFIFWLLTIRDLKINGNWKTENGKFIKNSVLGLGIFALLMSPLLIFDIRHNWQNSSAIKAFFTTGHSLGFSLSLYLQKVGSVAAMLFADLLAGKNIYLGISIIVIILLFVFWIVKGKLLTKSHVLLFTWSLVGLFGVALYKGSIYDHYLEFLFPIPFLLLGILSQSILKVKGFVLKIVLILGLGYLVFYGFKNNSPFAYPTMQLARSMDVARVIQEKANGQRFNLATISDFNNRDVYEYFLLLWGTKIVDTDPSSIQFTVTDQLFVVCEFPREKCDPIHNPSAWITNFGWTKITDEWPVWGGTLFKLGHTK